MTRLWRWLSGLAALFFVSASLLFATPAQAAAGDAFDRFEVSAEVDTDGYVQVTETIVLRFGPGSGRHGLERTLWTREPDGDSYDVVYPIDQVSVSSPSGAPDDLSTTEVGDGRERYLRIRVGDPNQTVQSETATYVLSYRIGGLLRSSGSYDELYWDVTGSSMPRIVKATAAVTVPGGGLGTFCSVASPGSKGDCARSELDQAKVAQFAAADIPVGQVLTVGVKIRPALVANNTPIRVENADQANQAAMEAAGRIAAYTFLGSLVAAAIVPFIGWRYLRRHVDDRRFAGLPPGTVPAAGQPAPEVPNDRRIQIPVAFTPPDVPVGLAGYLLDGVLDARDTTATLMSLAVNGAVKLRSDGKSQVVLEEPSRVPDPVAGVLFTRLFGHNGRRGKTVDLGEAGDLVSTHAALRTEVEEEAVKAGWFARKPSGGAGCGGIATGFFGLVGLFIVGVNLVVFLGSLGVLVVVGLLAAAPLVLSIVITVAVVGFKKAKGQRSGYGRAVADQIEGFRTYLGTAEAEQLRFEEGEDIFSKYLPWAIAFGMAERWARVCQRLIELGRLSPAAPAWYYGSSWNMNDVGWQVGSLDSAVAASVVNPPSTSDTGFGSSGSSFSSGGGFSGGGGGGGGGGSW